MSPPLNWIKLFLNLIKTVFCVAILVWNTGLFADSPIPRTILVPLEEGEPNNQKAIHTLFEMPANQFGYNMHYQSIHNLPQTQANDDVTAIFIWFIEPLKEPHLQSFVKWVVQAVDQGKKVMVIGNPFAKTGDFSSLYYINRFWKKLGLRWVDQSVDETSNMKVIHANHRLVGFERKLEGIKPNYSIIDVTSPLAVSQLVVQAGDDEKTRSTLILTNPNGCYLDDNYIIYQSQETDDLNEVSLWYINPFTLFQVALQSPLWPIPDTTTLAGERIYYSQVDGDGWENGVKFKTGIEGVYNCAEMFYHKILSDYPDLPITVGPIGAELALNWVGTVENQELAKEMFLLPHVEAGCHTFSHPFDWNFFEHYTVEKELPYLALYPDGNWEYHHGAKFIWNNLWNKPKTYAPDSNPIQSDGLTETYSIPRAFALKPFDLNLEVFGAINQINSLSDKKVQVYQWSGNCLPFPEAVRLVDEAKVRNINGGDSRFDQSYNSYSWVRAIGRQVGQDYRQIYASNSNENIYTNMWRSHFYNFTQLIQSFQNTGTPLRVKPIHLYYHLYSMENFPSMQAVFSNLDYVRHQAIIPIHTSLFSAIADGFYRTSVIPIAEKKWQIKNRGALQTVRFDRSTFNGVDFAQSHGVVGQRHSQGSLYVYLDEKVEEPIVAVKEIESFFEEPIENIPYLVNSRWRVSGLKNMENGFEYMMEGFGQADTQWRVPHNGEYEVSVWQGAEKLIEQSINVDEHFLTLKFEYLPLDPLKVLIRKQ